MGPIEEEKEVDAEVSSRNEWDSIKRAYAQIKLRDREAEEKKLRDQDAQEKLARKDTI